MDRLFLYIRIFECNSVIASDLAPSNSQLSHVELLAARRRQLKAVQLLFLVLPVPNKELLTGLLSLLVEVTRHTENNRMNAENLGIIMGPILMYPDKVRI